MPTPHEHIRACFPLAARYADRMAHPNLVREPTTRHDTFDQTERHIQCIWADPQLRPPRLTTHRGEPVEIENAGIWNLEAGPDFIGAVLRIGTDRRRITGDIEIHIHPTHWNQHRHATDPNYTRVIAHITWFHAPLPDNQLPSGCAQISLHDTLTTDPHFSLENIDTTAYPYAARADLPPCSLELRTYTPEQKAALLDSAGEERLRRKAERLATLLTQRDPEQILYEETLAALGYKNNKAPLRRIAELLPLTQLRQHANGNPHTAYALLTGLTGLLPTTVRTTWDPETRTYIRTIWDEWWKHSHEWQDRTLPRHAWKLTGLRPLNHPLRRLAAAAQLFTTTTPHTWLNHDLHHILTTLQNTTDPYWSHRESLAGKRTPAPIQLIGPDRAHTLATNVITPLLAALGKRTHFQAGLLDHLPLEPDNTIIRQTARYLFGPDHPTKLHATPRRRQGLLQIFHDHCLNDRSRCATCPFPAALRNFTA